MRCIVTVVSHGVSQCLNGGVDNFLSDRDMYLR